MSYVIKEFEELLLGLLNILNYFLVGEIICLDRCLEFCYIFLIEE